MSWKTHQHAFRSQSGHPLSRRMTRQATRAALADSKEQPELPEVLRWSLLGLNRGHKLPGMHHIYYMVRKNDENAAEFSQEIIDRFAESQVVWICENGVSAPNGVDAVYGSADRLLLMAIRRAGNRLKPDDIVVVIRPFERFPAGQISANYLVFESGEREGALPRCFMTSAAQLRRDEMTYRMAAVRRE